MSIDYNDRGIFHKVVNHTPLKLNKSKNALIRNSSKALLKAEKVTLFAKDIVTNKLVGKEFHIRFERMPKSSGSHTTRLSLVRANKPAFKERGILHRLSAEHRRFEGDAPNFSITRRINNIQPITRHGKVTLNSVKTLNYTRRTAEKVALKSALAAETAAIEFGSFGFRRLTNNLRMQADQSDAGKLALTSLTTARTINQARKAVITQKLKKSEHKIAKLEYQSARQKLKKKKASYKSEKTDYKHLKKKLRQRKIPKKLLKVEKAEYKVQRRFVRNIRKRKHMTITMPLSLKVCLASAARPVSAMSNQIDKEAADNEFYQAFSKVKKGISEGNRHRKNNKAKKVRKTHNKSNKLHQKQNRLQERKTKLQAQKTKRKKTVKKKTPKKKDVVKKIVAKFFKFILKFVGAISLPLIIIIFFFALVLMMFGGGAENNTYILGTYNCTDYTMAQAIDAYTEIAYDFNQIVMRCQQQSTWKSGLSSMGVNTSSYEDVPTEFIFGNSSYFPYNAVYDFDYDKFIAFMCAYTYDFSVDNEDVALWTWKSEYEDVIQDLFDKEYEFKHKYINTSHWVTVNSFTAYPSFNEFWYADGTGITTVSGNKYGYLDFSSSGLPDELKNYTNDKFIHFDLNTGEIKNRKKAYGKTGMYVQNLNYEYTLSSGSKINSFYKNVVSGSTGSIYKGFKIGDTWYHKTQLYVGDYAFNYAMAKEDVRLYVDNQGENRQLIRDFKQEEYVKECKLYTNVYRKRTFDEAIRLVLNNSSYSSERIEFYNTLLNADNIETYGNHQMYKSSPLNTDFSTLINQGKIYNGYGYDMQEWNSKHCGLFGHDGIDIEAASGTNVYSMIDGKIDSIDSENHTITVITTENLNYWYDDNNNRSTKIIYTNVTAKFGLQVGNTVNSGDLIGKVDTYKHCYDNISNTSASKNYLHISVYIKYGIFGWDWHSVDPRFLIYLENE